MEILNKSRPTIQEMASFVGMMTASFPAVMYGPLHYRSIDIDKNDALKQSKGNFSSHMTLSSSSLEDLRWWVASLPSAFNVVRHPEYDCVIYTDASSTGWGGVLGDLRTGGQWTPAESLHHINYLEILAVLMTLKAFHNLVTGKHVRVLIDNTTSVATINHMGTSHSRECNLVNRLVWDWCVCNSVWLSAAHIPGVSNTLADIEFRQTLSSCEWALDSDCFAQAGQKVQVTPDIDLFASRLNYKLKPFVAFKPDPEASAINAFGISWSNYSFYAFPPFSILPKVLQKIQSDKATGLLVIPKWPTQSWWPRVMRMLTQYNPYIKRWQLYCGERKIDPISAPLEVGVNYFAELYNTGIGYSALNTARSALSSYVILPDNLPFGTHLLVRRFMKGVFENRPPFLGIVQHGTLQLCWSTLGICTLLIN